MDYRLRRRTPACIPRDDTSLYETMPEQVNGFLQSQGLQQFRIVENTLSESFTTDNFQMQRVSHVVRR